MADLPDNFRCLRGAPRPEAVEEAAILAWLDQAVAAPPSPAVALLEADEVTQQVVPLPAPRVAPASKGPDLDMG